MMHNSVAVATALELGCSLFGSYDWPENSGREIDSYENKCDVDQVKEKCHHLRYVHEWKNLV